MCVHGRGLFFAGGEPGGEDDQRDGVRRGAAHYRRRQRKLRALGPAPYRFVFDVNNRSVRSWEAPLDDFRRELGLPASPHPAMFEGQFSPLRNLALFDPQLARPQPDWPANVRVCGAAITTASRRTGRC